MVTTLMRFIQIISGLTPGTFVLVIAVSLGIYLSGNHAPHPKFTWIILLGVDW